MDDWRHARLGELAANVTVGHVGPMAREYVSSGVPFLRSQNVQPFRLDLTDVKHVAPAFHEILRKSALAPGDVVIVRTGKPGAAAVIPESLPVANCADLVIIRPGSQLDPRWLAYFINAAAGHFVSSRLVGAVQQHFNVGSARDLLLKLPPLDEQRCIAGALGALDDKIESNQRMGELCNNILTAHADSVRGAEVPVSALAQVSREAIDPARLGDEQVDLFSLPAFDAGPRPERCRASSIASGKFNLRGPSVLLSHLNPRFPRLWLAIPETGVTAMCSTEFMVLHPRPGVTLTEIWLGCSQSRFQDAMTQRASGTSGSHQRVRSDDVLAINIPNPSSLSGKILEEASQLLDLIDRLRHQSAILVRLRDALLPELLAGRLRVRAHDFQEIPE